MAKTVVRIKIVFLLTLVVVFANCAPKEKRPTRFRVGQFLFSTQKATVALYENNQKKTSLELDYGKLSDYQSIAAKTYFVKVWADGELLLEKKIGLGRNDDYTLLLTGIPEKNQSVNKESILTTLHSIAEGSEGITTNNFLPQLIIQNDFYVKENGKGKVRVSHLMPGTVPLSVKLGQKGTETGIGSKSYPESSETKAIDPGSYKVQLHFDGSPQTTAMGQMNIEQGSLYSLYLIPDSDRYLTNPQLVIGKTEKR